MQTLNIKQYAQLRKRSITRIGQQIRKILRLQENLSNNNFSTNYPNTKSLTKAIEIEYKGLPGVLSIGRISIGKSYRYVLTVNLSELHNSLNLKPNDLTLDYDNLECPICEKTCRPIKVLKNGTVLYEKHLCESEDDYFFSIDINGDLIEKS